MKSAYRTVLAASCLTLLFAGLVGSADEPAAVSPAAKMYATKCASCHGKTGAGNPAMAKVFKLDPAALELNGKTTADKTDEELIKITTEGAGKMPAYKEKLSADEIKALVAHMRTLAPAEKK